MVLDSSAQSGQAHSCIRPLDCGVTFAAGPYGDAKDRVHIAYASLKALRSVPGFPDPVSLTVCPYTILRPAYIPPGYIRPPAQMTGAGSL